MNLRLLFAALTFLLSGIAPAQVYDWTGDSLPGVKILNSRERGECPCVDVIAIAERHLDDVSKQIETLRNFKKELSGSVKQWKKAGKQTLAAGAICSLIERTMDAKSPKGKR